MTFDGFNKENHAAGINTAAIHMTRHLHFNKFYNNRKKENCFGGGMVVETTHTNTIVFLAG